MVPNMAGFNKVENMMLSFSVFDAFLSSGVAHPIPIFILFLILNENLRQF